jgi:hypothetical protein
LRFRIALAAWRSSRLNRDCFPSDEFSDGNAILLRETLRLSSHPARRQRGHNRIGG